MVYAVASDARNYCNRLSVDDTSDAQLTTFIQIVTDRDINPLLKKQYDITSAEVTGSGVVKQLTAMGAAVEAMRSLYSGSDRSDLLSDLQTLQEAYDALMLEVDMGNKKV
jgi:hypothetical protein